MGKRDRGANTSIHRVDGLNEEQVIERDQRIWQLRQQGKLQKEIAVVIGCSQATVSAALKARQKEAEQELLDMVVEVKLAHIERLNFIMNEALDAWQRSKLPRSVASEKNVNPQTNIPASQTTPARVISGKGRSETSKRAETRIGDSKYLAEARAAMQDIRKIVGADAPIVSINDTSSSWAESVKRAMESVPPLSDDDDDTLEAEVIE